MFFDCAPLFVDFLAVGSFRIQLMPHALQFVVSLVVGEKNLYSKGKVPKLWLKKHNNNDNELAIKEASNYTPKGKYRTLAQKVVISARVAVGLINGCDIFTCIRVRCTM